MNYGYELRARFAAGLQLVGQGAEGKLEWMGTLEQWSQASEIEAAFAKRITVHHENN